MDHGRGIRRGSTGPFRLFRSNASIIFHFDLHLVEKGNEEKGIIYFSPEPERSLLLTRIFYVISFRKKKRKKKMRREKFVIRSVLQIPGRVNEDWIIIFETDPAEIVSFTTLQLPA